MKNTTQNIFICILTFLSQYLIGQSIGSFSTEPRDLILDTNTIIQLENVVKTDSTTWYRIAHPQRAGVLNLSINSLGINQEISAAVCYIIDDRDLVHEKLNLNFDSDGRAGLPLSPLFGRSYLIEIITKTEACTTCSQPNPTFSFEFYPEQRSYCLPPTQNCNFFRNPGFENPLGNCPNNQVFSSGKYNPCFWVNPTCTPVSSTATLTATPDYFHTCWSASTSSLVPNYYTGGNNGSNGASGFFLYSGSGSNYREYITTILTETTIPNQIYQLSMYVKNMAHKFSCRDLQVVLSTNPLCQTSNTTMLIPNNADLVNLSTSVITNTNYQQYTRYFTPTGARAYVTIGNFKTDALTSTALNTAAITLTSSAFAYYNIDDVVLKTSAIKPFNTFALSCPSTTFQFNPQVCHMDGFNYVYSWSPTIGLSNPNVLNPIVNINSPMTYTLTQLGTGPQGTTNVSAVAVVTLGSGLPYFTSVQPEFICSNYNQSATLSAAPASAGGFTWSGGTPGSTSIIVSPTTSTIYTVTCIYNGCISSQTVQVAVSSSCCPNPSNYPTFTSANVTSHTTLNAAALINRNITISSGTQLKLSSAEYLFAPDVKIKVSPTATLIIEDAHFYACTNMWQGIEVAPGGYVLTNKLNSDNLIEDAKIGIDCNYTLTPTSSQLTSTPFLKIENTTFNRNRVAIRIVNCSLNVVNYPFLIRSCVFTNRNLPTTAAAWPQTGTTNSANNTSAHLRYLTGSSLASLAPPFLGQTGFNYIGLKAPYLNQSPLYALHLENVGGAGSPVVPHYVISIGDPNSTSFFNLFDSYPTHIYALNCHLNSYNNVFQNSLAQPGPIVGIPQKSSGIKFISDFTNYNFWFTKLNLTAPVNAATAVNRFYNCRTAVECVNASTVIINNAYFASTQNKNNTIQSFNTGYYGVYIEGHKYFKYDLVGNKFINIANGIKVSMNSNSVTPIFNGQAVASFSAANNFFCPSTSTSVPIGNGFVQTGIWIENAAPSAALFSTTVNNGFKVSYNNFYKVWNGIKMNGFTGTNYNKVADNNIIYLEPAVNPALSQSGIEYVNIPRGIINTNIVIGFGSATTSINSGIYCGDSQSLTVNCNSVSVLNRGFQFNGNDKFSSWRVNTMQSNFTGMYASNWGMSSTSGIGIQGGPNNPADNYWIGSNSWQTYVDGNTAVLTSSLYNRSAGVGYYLISSLNGPLWNPFLSYNNSIATPTTLGTSNIICGANGTGGSCVTCSNRQWIDVAIDQSILEDPTSEINQFILFQNLNLDSALASSNDTLANFYIENSQGNLGTLSKIEGLIALKNYTDANSLLLSLVPETNVQATYKEFLQHWLHFSEENALSFSDSVALSLLSQQCPVVDGPGVYLARALRNHIYGLCELYVDENCAPEGFSSRGVSPDAETTIADKKTLRKQESQRGGNSLPQRIRIFPNPAHELLTVQTTFPIPFGFEITDISGRPVYQNSSRIEAGSVNLSLSEVQLENGIYFINLYIDQKRKECKKLIIEKK